MLRQFAANLRAARVRANLSQEGLAEVIDLHRTEVGLMERAKREPRLSTLLVLAEGLGVSVADLVEGLPVPTGRRAPTHAKTGR